MTIALVSYSIFNRNIEFSVNAFLNISSCEVSNCKIWNDSNQQVCTQWDDGYRNDRDASYCEATTKKTIVSIAVGLVSTFISINGVLGICSTSPSQSIFSMINHFQILMLMPLIGAYIPKDIYDFLQGNSLLFLSVDTSLMKYLIIPEILNDFADYEQSSYYLNVIGLESGSALITQLHIILSILLVGWITLLLIPIYSCIKKPIVSTLYSKIMPKIMNYFVYAIYLRIMIQTYFRLTLSSFYEISHNELNTVNKSNSYKFAIILATISCWFTIHVCWTWAYSYYKQGKGLHSCNEYYEGYKKNNMGRLSIVVFVLKRFIFILLAVYLSNETPIINIAILIIIFLMSLFHIVTYRPVSSFE